MKYDKLQTTKTETAGFTLVEIVAVLVLLGILAAVAVPKFFDLSSDAEKKAAEAALMEAQVRINAGYSKAIYAGKSCEDAVSAVSSLEKIGDGGKNVINGYTLMLKDGNELKEAPGSYVTLTKSGKSFDSSTFDNLKQIFKPTCDADSSDTSTNGGLVCPGENGGNSGSEGTDKTCPSAECKAVVVCRNNKIQCECTCESGDCSCSGLTNLSCTETSGSAENKPGAYVWGKDRLPCDGNKCPAGLVIKSDTGLFYLTGDLWIMPAEAVNQGKEDKYPIESLNDYGKYIVKITDTQVDCSSGEYCYPALYLGDVYFNSDENKWYGNVWDQVGGSLLKKPSGGTDWTTGWVELLQGNH